MPNTEPDYSSEAKNTEVHVAVGVVINRARQVLISRRHSNQHQGGLWEFPGGKVDVDESVLVALKRELFEEVALKVHECAGLLKIRHDYGDKRVLLDVWVVSVFSGEPRGCEGQPVKWVSAQELDLYDFPDANQEIIRAVKNLLPPGP